jgi:hypothetical protein
LECLQSFQNFHVYVSTEEPSAWTTGRCREAKILRVASDLRNIRAVREKEGEESKDALFSGPLKR